MAVAFSAAAFFPHLTQAQGGAAPVRLLDVPYLPQSEALCGGAAAAMVMRFWGETGVYADSFADLLAPRGVGIKADDLVRALRARGWDSAAFRGDSVRVRSNLAARRPMIVLIEANAGRFHYVVVVGWSSGRVILHDPARAPFRVLDEDAFERAWSRSDFWTMLVLPRAGRQRETLSVPPVSSVQSPEKPERDACEVMIEEGITLASTASDETRRLFEVAATICPRDPAPWRELAGLAALQKEWRTASTLAREALVRHPGDAHAASILATSLFLLGEADEALVAWNGLGEPIIDRIDIRGLERTRYSVIARALRLEPRALLTREQLVASRRRLAELSAATVTQVAYTPGEDGRANVQAAVVERPLLPSGALPLGVLAARAATDREVTLSLASPTGAGEVLAGSWRWWEQRPRLAIAFSAPSPSDRLGAVWRIDASDERQTYGSAGTLIEHRRSMAFSVADWTSGHQRWEAVVGADRWNGLAPSLRVGAGIQRRAFVDRMTLEITGSLWTGGVTTAALRLGGEWRSAVRNEGTVGVTRAGVDVAGQSAPFALWSGAGTGQGRDALLRAHPLLDDGVIRGGVFGRRLIHAGGEWRRWMRPGSRTWRVAPAVFVDAARATHGLPESDTRAHVDAGLGLRIGLVGAGVLRVDIARGLRDGATALSVGWTR